MDEIKAKYCKGVEGTDNEESKQFKKLLLAARLN